MIHTMETMRETLICSDPFSIFCCTRSDFYRNTFSKLNFTCTVQNVASSAELPVHFTVNVLHN